MDKKDKFPFFYKKINSLEDRQKDMKKIKELYPDKVPIIVEKSPDARNLALLPKTKFLLSKYSYFSELVLLIRTKLSLREEEALFFLIDGKYSVLNNQTLGEIYEKYKDPEDGLLYLVYAPEKVHG